MADELKASPQNATLGAIARALRAAQQYTGQYQVDPRVPLLGGTGVDELLGLPGAAGLVEDVSYYGPRAAIRGGNVATGGIGTFRPDPRVMDVADVAGVVAPLAGAATKAAGRGATAVGNAAVRAITGNPEATGMRVLEEAARMPSLSNVVKPRGNVNLRPSTGAEKLRGPDVQPVQNLLAQVRKNPGMTSEGFERLVERYSDVPTGTKMSKTDFEGRVPASALNVVDLKGAGGISREAFWEEAEDLVYQDPFMVFEGVMDRLGVRNPPEGEYQNFVRDLENFHAGNIGPEELPPQLREALDRNGMLENQDSFMGLVQDEFVTAIDRTAEQLVEYGDHWGEEVSPYRWSDVQRLVKSIADNEAGYVELGVTHPELAGTTYRHYPNFSDAEGGLLGHIRGTKFAEPGEFVVPDAFSISKDRTLMSKPNSFLIEELQSDAQKGVKQSGPMLQAHGVLFKSAVDNALRGGAENVYYPTARTISAIRMGKPENFAPIYDKEVMKYGLDELRNVPGVTVTPLEVDPQLGPAYYELNFSPEAREYLLSGPGQRLPGYNIGGAVKMDEGGGVISKIGDFANRMVQKAGDSVIENSLKLYDKLQDRSTLPTNQRVFLDTFLDNKRDTIDTKQFSPEELHTIRNLIGITGDKPSGSVQYDQYGIAGLQRKDTAMNGDVIAASKNPLESVRTTLGQFRYRKDPNSNNFIVEDQYDFNMPQKYIEGKNDYGDYAMHSMSNPLWAMRIYAGRKMPQGTGRKVRVEVPYAQGGAVQAEFDPSAIDAVVNKFYEEHHG